MSRSCLTTSGHSLLVLIASVADVVSSPDND
jgi:hypothetical protein